MEVQLLFNLGITLPELFSSDAWGVAGCHEVVAFGNLFKAASVQRLVHLQKALAQTFLVIGLLVLFDLDEQLLKVPLGVLGDLAAAMAIKHSKQVLLTLERQVVNGCIFL